LTSTYKAHLWENVFHLNLHGSARDTLVDQNIANFIRFNSALNPLNQTAPLLYSLDIKSTSLKNVYQNMDHNSLFYYKHFWDSVAPLIYNVALLSPKSAKMRYELAKNTLNLNLNDQSVALEEVKTYLDYNDAVKYTLFDD
jgi:hypothetical protein